MLYVDFLCTRNIQLKSGKDQSYANIRCIGQKDKYNLFYFPFFRNESLFPGLSVRLALMKLIFVNGNIDPQDKIIFIYLNLNKPVI